MRTDRYRLLCPQSNSTHKGSSAGRSAGRVYIVALGVSYLTVTYLTNSGRRCRTQRSGFMSPPHRVYIVIVVRRLAFDNVYCTPPGVPPELVTVPCVIFVLLVDDVVVYRISAYRLSVVLLVVVLMFFSEASVLYNHGSYSFDRILTKKLSMA